MIVPKVFFAGKPGAGNFPPGAEDRLHILPYLTATVPSNRYWLLQQAMITNISYQIAYWTIGILPAYDPSGNTTTRASDLFAGARYIGFGRALAPGDTEIISLSQWLLPVGAGPRTYANWPSPPDSIWTAAWPGQYPTPPSWAPPNAILMTVSGLEFS